LRRKKEKQLSLFGIFGTSNLIIKKKSKGNQFANYLDTSKRLLCKLKKKKYPLFLERIYAPQNGPVKRKVL
jgi:hypothetical protein